MSFGPENHFNARAARSISSVIRDAPALRRRIAAEELLRKALSGGAVDVPLLKMSLVQGACPDRTVNGSPPLHVAVRLKSAGAFFALLRSGASLADTDGDGNTVLDLALKTGWHRARRVLERMEAPYNACTDKNKEAANDYGASSYQARADAALIEAIEKSTRDAVEGALDLGADPNARDERSARSYSALHLAVRMGEKDKVDLLIGRGADVYARSAAGEGMTDMLWHMRDSELFSPRWYALFDHLRGLGCRDFFVKTPDAMSIDEMRLPPPVQGLQDTTVLHMLTRAGKFSVVLERLRKFPREKLKAEDFLRRSSRYYETLIVALARGRELGSIFTPEVWQGRIGEMARVWAEIEKTPYSTQVDFEGAKGAVLRCRQTELRRRAQARNFGFGKG